LGAILYKLVTGRSPHESDDAPPQPIAAMAGAREIPPAKRWNPDVPTDIDCILRKALRNEPEERYVSVEALADDIRAFLDSRPVQARSGNAWYRTRKFVRRYWLPVAAAAAVIASLSAGLYLANRQRLVAESRFRELRQLSTKVFALDEKIRNLPGSTKARQDLVSASLEYLEGLASQVQHDPDLAQEVAEGYWQIAQIQGVPTGLNLGESPQAEANLKKSDVLTDAVLAARPHDGRALERSAFIAQDRMILAEQDHRRAEALMRARETADRASRLLREPQLRTSQIDNSAVLFGNVALAHTNMHLYSDAVRYAQRSVELVRQLPSSQFRVGQSLSLLANALRYEGDLDGALRAIEEARSLVEAGVYHDSTIRAFHLYGVILRQGLILGEDGGVSLGRRDEAARALQVALDMNEQIARADPNDSVSRGRVGTLTRELGKILHHTDPEHALAVFDLGIRRLGEIPTNLKARRDRATLLAGSSYPLRSLHRIAEARRRIDAAIALLKETKDYPASRVPLDSEIFTVLQAQADSEADDGDASVALKLYEKLLGLVMAGEPEPLIDLRDAPRMSGLYASLAALCRRTGKPAEAATMESRRLDLWQNWQRKLPNNSFVQHHLAAQGT
jgi:tetratricopeptide (TPR) repeat protein